MNNDNETKEIPILEGTPVSNRQPCNGNGLATASLVLGILSVPFFWWGLFSLAFVVLAVIFGAIGMQNAEHGAPNKGQAIAGLVCGSVGGFFYLIFGIVTLGAGFLI